MQFESQHVKVKVHWDTAADVGCHLAMEEWSSIARGPLAGSMALGASHMI